ALRLLGLGTAATAPVPAGPGGGISGPALARALAAGPPGPTIVCLQAGEVNTGGFDDFPAAVAAARERGAWVHVDGAFGLWAAASPRTRHLTAGAEAADSWATDGHKWLNVPYDCGYAFCARPRAHQAAMAFTAAYLGDAPETLRSPADWGLESSRRARALATWAALRELGRDRIAALVERCCAHARRFARLLSAAEGVRVVNDVALNQVLVRFGDNDDATERVVAAVQRSGVCWMGSTTWRGMRLMRISVSSWRTTTADVDRSAEAILAAAAGCGLPPGLGQLTDDCRGGAPQDVTRQTGGLGVCLVREIPLMHTQSGAASFSACQQLFRDHQLAVTPPAADSGYPAMVLRHRTAGFFVLTRLEESLFLLRSWRDRSPPGSWHDDDHAGEDVSHDDVAVEIRPGKPVPDLVRQVIVGCLPVPRHGALLGWVTGHQVTALLTVRSKPPVGGARGSPPEIRVLPQAGTSPKQDWPPFCADPLGEWGLWEYIGWHELVDVLPLVTRAAGRAFWVPSPDGRRTGNLVLAGHIRTDEFWLPAGVYADQWALREGIDPPSAGRLAASPGAVDLARAGFC
ncbi:MAG: hypothetical protein J2P25_11745, partial [Nocardiopsaceae bacterium]|nr:hypothetical protein [Nocardiopsaceae bacterium]